ncbi:hypothetical protein [Rhodopirellula bahusiensis]|uniref:Uncharacterized protein n=1 Tax=Rhodopirellula bahusiensis TaxID=2014065 RepID=A0A2G1W7F0_9BACT|nr:hypothetical protein [Rhodopirellula bahusiensis]PHQ34957.1 hypothetical protein CEE69_13175 [Rhodopirellula bahusiensis]
MGWLFREDITRKELIAERTESWERQSGETIVQSECLAHCFRGCGFSGVLWAVWERRFIKDGEDTEPTQRWITCDLIQYRRDAGFGYKDMDESMGPYYYSCPMKYLNMVPIDRFGGNSGWREMVIDHHQRQREKRKSRAIIV